MNAPGDVRDVIRTIVDDVRLKAAAAVDQGTRDELPFVLDTAFHITLALNAEFGVQGVWWTIVGVP